MFDKDEFKKSLTIEDIKRVLDYYNADYFMGQNGEIVSETICHNRSGGSHKLYYYDETHTFHCYTHCGNFDIYELIENVNKTRGRKITFSEAIKELGAILGRNVGNSKRVRGIQKAKKSINDWDWLSKIQRKEKMQPQLKIHNANILKYFPEVYPSAWYDEGISIESMEKYNIKFYPEAFQTVIPHYDGDGNLIGIRSRNWDKQSVKRAKYIPTYVGDRAFNHPLGFALYGLYQNKEAIKRKKKVVITEGEKSCLFSDTFYGDENFVVAICGSSMSKYQADLLLDLGVEKVIIALDKEYLMKDTEEYNEYMNKVKRIARMFAPYVSTYHLTDTRGKLGLKESPFDMPKDELEDMMRNDKHLITLKDLEKR